ncbi:hypothetical protein HYT25_02920 [Candidatus Pacearchaeota archaeon]|nr:hypothetical protein [Candidatus Pacearchaeota archaeon]
MRKQTRKRGKYNFTFNLSISQRTAYTLIAILILLIVGVGVWAVAGTTPNPGHSLSQLQPCSNGEILKMSGSAWSCSNLPSSVETDPTVNSYVKDKGSCAAITGGAALCDGIDDTVPSGAIMFFDATSCPTGWAAVTAARGRYLVGLPSGGILAGTVGTILGNREERVVGQHNHGVGTLYTYNTGGHSHTFRADSGSGNVYVKTGSAGSSTVTTSTTGAHAHTISGSTANTGSVTGTNAPYIQYLVCRKN